MLYTAQIFILRFQIYYLTEIFRTLPAGIIYILMSTIEPHYFEPSREKIIWTSWSSEKPTVNDWQKEKSKRNLMVSHSK